MLKFSQHRRLYEEPKQSPVPCLNIVYSNEKKRQNRGTQTRTIRECATKDGHHSSPVSGNGEGLNQKTIIFYFPGPS